VIRDGRHIATTAMADMDIPKIITQMVLAGTVIEHMCALLDVSELAELIASGGAKHLDGGKPVRKPK
jgi:ABC-type sugar transport system ATPase subunit